MEAPDTRLTSQLAPEPVSHFRESIGRWGIAIATGSHMWIFAIDPHTNQKDYEVAFDLRRHSLRDYGGHSNLRLWGSVHGSISPSRP